MKTYPAVRDPGSIELLFRNVRASEPPDKITTDFLSSIGFRRQSDVKLLELLFFLGLIDSNLAPTALWKGVLGCSEGEFREKLAPEVLRAYSRIFAAHPAGGELDGRSMLAMFKSETGVTDTEAAYMVLTLQVLSDITDLGARASAEEKAGPHAVPAPKEPPEAPAQTLPDVPDEPAPRVEMPQEGLSLNITIPPDAMDAEMTEIVKALLRKLI